MNNTTRKFPRTLDEAFGPYQRHGLVEQYDPMPREDKIVTIIGGVVLVGVVVALVMGWM
jgi:hypothetical protein